MYEFEDISKTSHSEVWLHMLKDRNAGKAFCKICSIILENRSSSTTSLQNHLRLKHKIIFKSERKIESENESENGTPKKWKPSMQTEGKVIGNFSRYSNIWSNVF